MIFPSAPNYPPESERKNEQAKPNYYNLRGKNLRSRKKFFTFLKKIADFDKIAQKNSYTYKVLPVCFFARALFRISTLLIAMLYGILMN